VAKVRADIEDEITFAYILSQLLSKRAPRAQARWAEERVVRRASRRIQTEFA
jgi:hypothetical protein